MRWRYLIAFFFLALSASADVTGPVTGTLPSAVSSPSNGQCLVYNGTVWANASCGAGGGSFSALTSGTNTSAAMLVGTGASLGTTGSGTITANAFTGTLPVANGGTGQTTASAALTALLPTLVSSDCLGNNGTTVSWVTCGSGGISSITLTAPSIFTVTGSPLIANGTLAISYSGTALPVANGGTGATTLAGAFIPTFTGGITATHCAEWSASGILEDSGAGCGGSSAFSALLSGTNTSAAMLVGSGASLGPTGSGTITANALSSGIALGTPGSGTLTNETGLPLATGITGTLPVANGGTGQTTAIAALGAASVVNAVAYGADPTGVADSTTYIQNALNTGNVVFFPCGTYKFSTLTLVTGGIVGQSRQCVSLKPTDTGSGATITVTTSNGNSPQANSGADFEHFSLQYSSTSQKTSGYTISINPTNTSIANSGAYFNDIYIQYAPTAVYFAEAENFTIVNSYFWQYTVAGVVLSNVNNQAGGDSSISSSVFGGYNLLPTGIVQQGSSGLRIINNKFISGLYGYQASVFNTESLSILVIDGNSFESFSKAIYFSVGGASGSISDVIVSNNEIDTVTSGCIVDDGVIAENGITITGNVCNPNSSVNGITLSPNNAVISGNTLVGGGTSTGLTVSGSGYAIIGPNEIQGFSTAMSASGPRIALTFIPGAPSIVSGFGTGPYVTNGNSAKAFAINVGSGGTASSGVVGLPAAPNGWNCSCSDAGNFSSSRFLCNAAPTSTTSVTVTQYNDTATASAWAANDILSVSCSAR